MSADSGQPVAQPAHVDIWRLPRILKIQARHAHYREPKRLTTRDGVQQIHEAVEVDLFTDEEIVDRALSPVLRVGGVVLTWGERVGKNHYRFRGVEPERSLLQEDSPVELVWPVRGPASVEKQARSAVLLPPITGRPKGKKPS